VPPPPPTSSIGLHVWLEAVCGLKGMKLKAATESCDYHLCESVEELRKLHAQGQLREVFQQVGIDGAVY
jgi:hypothetical protein